LRILKVRSIHEFSIKNSVLFRKSYTFRRKNKKYRMPFFFRILSIIIIIITQFFVYSFPFLNEANSAQIIFKICLFIFGYLLYVLIHIFASYPVESSDNITNDKRAHLIL